MCAEGLREEDGGIEADGSRRFRDGQVLDGKKPFGLLQPATGRPFERRKPRLLLEEGEETRTSVADVRDQIVKGELLPETGVDPGDGLVHDVRAGLVLAVPSGAGDADDGRDDERPQLEPFEVVHRRAFRDESGKPHEVAFLTGRKTARLQPLGEQECDRVPVFVRREEVPDAEAPARRLEEDARTGARSVQPVVYAMRKIGLDDEEASRTQCGRRKGPELVL